jgi:hypothetical protein
MAREMVRQNLIPFILLNIETDFIANRLRFEFPAEFVENVHTDSLELRINKESQVP